MVLKNTIVALQPGMYVLRHPGAGMAPLSVTRVPGMGQSEGAMESLATSGTQGALLRSASDCIVLRISNGPVELLVTAFLAREGEPVPALRVDRIDLDDAAGAATAPIDAAQKPFVISPQGLSIIAHVDGRGDVLAGNGEVLGEPEGMQAITGLQLMWPDRPAGVDVAYSVTLEGYAGLPAVRTGNFCGARDKGLRMNGLCIELVGEHAAQFRLDGVAFFSGGFQVCFGGGAVSGPSGFEHLVALSLKVCRRDSKLQSTIEME